MDFKKTGIPQYSINDPFRKFQESLENVTTIGFGAIRGNLVLDGNNYLIGKLIQLLGKSIYDNRRKIRKNMLSSLSFLTYRD